MKKYLMLLLAALVLPLSLILVSCGETGETTPDVTTPKVDVTTAPAEEEKPPFSEEDHIEKKDNTVTVTSLEGNLSMKLYQNAEGKLVYTLSTKDGYEIVAESEMNMNMTRFEGFDHATVESVSAKRITATYDYTGNFSKLTDDCVAATVSYKNANPFSVEIKLYENGVAFRYYIPKTSGGRSIRGEGTQFSINNIERVWHGVGSDCYESEIKSALYKSLKTTDKLNGPLMIELSDNRGYVSLLEGYVDKSYVGTNYVSLGENNTFKVSGSWTSGIDFDALAVSTDIYTGWRIVNYSKELGDISLNPIVYHTALGMEGKLADHGDFSYVTPGKSAWSWINDGSVPFDPQIQYTLNAARLGFTYNIIDEGYLNWAEYEDKLTELGALGKDNNVKQILWVYVTPYHTGWQINNAATAKQVIKKIADAGLSGIKLDFFVSESNKNTYAIQRATLEEALAKKIIVNFHGVHEPTSLAVEYPNELTREGIRGLEQGLRGNLLAQAKYYTTQFYTRLLAGHADFTPDANTAMQIASLVTLDSPLMVIATDPDLMLANPALEMIKAIPTTWDRTVFLDGKIGSYVSVAKENKGVWYVGGVASTNQLGVKVDLSKFLGEGEYMMTYWKDTNQSTKTKTTAVVTKNDKVEIGNIPAGCGYVMQFTKLSLSQYGGEITSPITVTTASPNATVKYTTDGSDPMTSATATTYTAPITLTDSCLLTVAITSGDGQGSTLSYRFNKVIYNGIDVELSLGDNKTTLSATPTTDGATLHYTVDGSIPTASSPVFAGEMTFSESTTVKLIAITKEGKTSFVKTVDVTVREAIKVVTPDVYLGRDYISATAGWDNRIAIDQSMNYTPLSLGGTNANNGTKFTHGISTNAIGTFVYAIPENATHFVGVTGIDDSVYGNAAEHGKASIITKIYADDVLIYTSAKLKAGDYESVKVEIPAGAERLKIVFGDAGDGITCDNADFCESGFILAK